MAGLVLIESISRFILGVLGNEDSASEDSFENQNLLSCPVWTRPRDLPSHQFPEVFLTGDHKKIQKFKKWISIVLTLKKRPDLIRKSGLSQNEVEDAKRNLKSLSSEEIKSLGLKREDLS